MDDPTTRPTGDPTIPAGTPPATSSASENSPLLEPTSTEEAQAGLADRAKKALASAQHALENARGALEQAYGTARTQSRSMAGRASASLDQAKARLDESRVMMKDMAAKSRQQVEALYAETSQRYEELSRRARDLRSKARQRVDELELGRRRDEVLDYIQQNPGTAVLIALAAGFVIGYATRPRA